MRTHAPGVGGADLRQESQHPLPVQIPPCAPGLLRPSCTAAGPGLFWHLSQTPDLLVSWTQLLIQEVGYSFSVFPFRCL